MQIVSSRRLFLSALMGSVATAYAYGEGQAGSIGQHGVAWSEFGQIIQCGRRGITFDYEGRLLAGAREGIVRQEHSGTSTLLRSPTPQDLVVHPDGSIWLSEANDAVCRLDPRTSENVVIARTESPRGICFSPDYSRLYVSGAGGIDIFSLSTGTRTRLTAIPHMGIRADSAGNIWATHEGGVRVFDAKGRGTAHISVSEPCTNLSFGGPRRNRLFVVSETSLHTIPVQSRGAHIA